MNFRGIEMKTRLVCAAALIAAFASAMTGCAQLQALHENMQEWTYVPDELSWTTKSSDKVIYDRAYKCLQYRNKNAPYFEPEHAIKTPGYSLIGPVPNGGYELYSQLFANIKDNYFDVAKSGTAMFEMYFSVKNKHAMLRTTDYSKKLATSRYSLTKVQVDSMTEAAVNYEKMIQQCIGE